MREIKFRAWDREEKRMTDANFSISRHGKIWWLNSDGALCGAFENPSYAPHYPLQSGFVLMQFTGLKDKNGKEIYEGDICTFPESPTNKTLYGVIEFKDSAYRWIEKPANGIQPCVSSLWRGNLEVIGNIYENPELIGGGNEIKG